MGKVARKFARKNSEEKSVKEHSIKKRGIGRSVLKGAGFAVLFLIMVGMISSFSSPSRYADNNAIYEGFGKVELDEGTYYGNLIGDAFTGEGIFEFLDGVRYAGSWEESQMQGEGSCIYPGIGTYQGMYEDAVRNGEGSFSWENGDSFTGTWENDAMLKGTYRFSDGSEYKGTFYNGRIADGTFTYAVPEEETDIIQLTMEIENGITIGMNLETTAGFSYNGKLDNGNASIIYSDGNTYSGTVNNGLPDGEGIYTWMEDGARIAKYNGYWKQGVMDGEGTYYYTSNDYPSLKGTFENGVPTGECTYTKEAGKIFTATWENGKCTSVK